MSSKPTKLPEWASSGVHVVEPSAGKKSDGHLSGEQPIPQYENWRANNVYSWAQWLDAVFTSGGTATGDMALAGNVVATDLGYTADHEHGHHACAWVQTSSGTGSFNGSLWTVGGATSLYSSMDYLTPGDQINSIDFVYDRAATGTVTVYLVRRPTTGGGESTVASNADTTSGSGVAAHTLTISGGHVVQAGYSYMLRADVTSSAQTFVSGHAHVTRPAP